MNDVDIFEEPQTIDQRFVLATRALRSSFASHSRIRLISTRLASCKFETKGCTYISLLSFCGSLTCRTFLLGPRDQDRAESSILITGKVPPPPLTVFFLNTEGQSGTDYGTVPANGGESSLVPAPNHVGHNLSVVTVRGATRRFLKPKQIFNWSWQRWSLWVDGRWPGKYHTQANSSGVQGHGQPTTGLIL